jgi:hypothetical protein
MPVNEARALNSDTTSTYVRTVGLLESATGTARSIGTLPDGMTADDFDTAMVREVLESCFTETVTFAPGVNVAQAPGEATAELGPDLRPLTERPAVGRMVACTPARMRVLESYASTAMPEAREFVTQRVLMVDALRVNLNDVLVVQLDGLDNVADAARAEAERLRIVAEERRALAQTSTEDSVRTQADTDYDTIMQELEQVTSIVDQIDQGVTEMRRLRRQLIDEAARNIAQLGDD